MVAFNTVKPGDTLYDCRMQKMGNTTMSRMATWSVTVVEVDVENRRVFAKWNGNPAQWMRPRQIERLRRTPAKTA